MRFAVTVSRTLRTIYFKPYTFYLSPYALRLPPFSYELTLKVLHPNAMRPMRRALCPLPRAPRPLPNNPKSEIKNPKSSDPATRTSPASPANLFQHLTALPLVHIIQRKAQGCLQQGGFVIDGHTGQLQLMKLEVKAIEEVH